MRLLGKFFKHHAHRRGKGINVEPWIIELGIGSLVGIVAYFLRQKDAAQEKQIFALWEKHDADAQALQELRERIAGRHYERTELDQKFDKLESAFKHGFDELGKKFDRLSETLLKAKP